jgi:hypothetical protein
MNIKHSNLYPIIQPITERRYAVVCFALIVVLGVMIGMNI